MSEDEAKRIRRNLKYETPSIFESTFAKSADTRSASEHLKQAKRFRTTLENVIGRYDQLSDPVRERFQIYMEAVIPGNSYSLEEVFAMLENLTELAAEDLQSNPYAFRDYRPKGGPKVDPRLMRLCTRISAMYRIKAGVEPTVWLREDETVGGTLLNFFKHAFNHFRPDLQMSDEVIRIVFRGDSISKLENEE